MAYIVIRTVKGRQYRYLQISYREGGKVKTAAEYLGPVGTWRRAPKLVIGLIGNPNTATSFMEPVLDEEATLGDIRAREEKYAHMIGRFEQETGLKMGPRDPVPIEKPVPTISSMMATIPVATTVDGLGTHDGQSSDAELPIGISS